MRCICIIVMLLNFVQFISSEYRQERATVVVCNHKYVIDCVTITRRIKRGEPYATNSTVTSKYEMGNNVTLKISLQGEGYGEVVVLKQKICDMLNVEWLAKYLNTYSNVDVTRCPIPAGNFKFINMQFPPKGMPIRFPSFFKGRICMQVTILATNTSEVINLSRVDLYN